MSRIFTALKLDYYSAIPTVKYMILVFYALSLVTGLAAKQPLASLVIVTVFSSSLCGAVFAEQERNNFNKLYSVLPLSKTEMIIGRYLLAFIDGIITIVAAVIIGMVVSAAVNAPVSWLSLLALASLFFVYYCFSTAISFPLFFRASYTVGQIFAVLPWLIIIFGLMLVGDRIDIEGVSTEEAILEMEIIKEQQIPLIITGITTGTILLAISALVSRLIYTQKDVQ